MNQLVLDLQPSNPEYRKIPLTQGQFALVDAADFEWLSQWKWFAHWQKCTRSFYAVRRQMVDGPSPKRQIEVSMSRFIIDAPKGKTVDHHNHDTLDNRRRNLRIATYRENARNRGKSVINSSGLKGVTWKKEAGKWYAQIQTEKKNKYLGYFSTREAAHEAYKKAAIELYGEFACFG